MTTPQKPGAQAPDNTPTAAPAAAAPADTGKTASEERVRIKAITGCDEAKGRETLAEHLAFNTEMSADDAKKLLAAAPKAAAKEANDSNPFEAAMVASGNPRVGADAGNTSPAAKGGAAALLRDYGAASGRDMSK